MPTSQPRSPFDLVRFKRPPVAEVALTAQFGEPVIDLAAVGQFAEQVQKQFPNQSQRQAAAPIDPETFDLSPTAPPPFRIQFAQEVQLPRLWFESSSSDRLIQLQSDRLAVNWRLLDGDPTEYPHYAELRKVFEAQLKRLRTIVRKSGRDLDVTACEVLYVNPIEPVGKAEPGMHPDLASVVNRVSRSPTKAFLGRPEDSQYQARWRIPGPDGQSVGRLYLSAEPAVSDSQDSIYLVQLVGRTIPTGAQTKAVMEALDLGHEWVVRGFADVTTKAMHKIWERED